LGVYNAALTELLGGVLGALGTECAYVVHGADGLDELSTTGPNRVTKVTAQGTETFTLDAQEYGLPRATLADLAGGTPEENAATSRRILAGEKGPKRDVVLLNAGVALVAGRKASGLAEGIRLAAESIDSGRALQALDRLVEMNASFPRE